VEKVIAPLAGAIVSLGTMYILAAVLVGADTLIPHKYIVVDASTGKKYVANKKP
jgi:hypothetical protein